MHHFILFPEDITFNIYFVKMHEIHDAESNQPVNQESYNSWAWKIRIKIATTSVYSQVYLCICFT